MHPTLPLLEVGRFPAVRRARLEGSFASYSTQSYWRPSRRRPVCSTRWQGTANANQLREQALATARIALGAPIASAILE
jgi:hypothetical protein